MVWDRLAGLRKRRSTTDKHNCRERDTMAGVTLELRGKIDEVVTATGPQGIGDTGAEPSGRAGAASQRGDTPPAADAAEWRRRRDKLRKRYRDWVPRDLGPPEVFSDRRGSATEREHYGLDVPAEETGRRSRTVTSRLRMSCAGWRKVPSAEEFHDAVHRPAGTDREAAILLTWFHEAEMAEQLDARLEEAYSWRQLVRALHRVGLTKGEGARRINRFAKR